MRARRTFIVFRFDGTVLRGVEMRLSEFTMALVTSERKRYFSVLLFNLNQSHSNDYCIVHVHAACVICIRSMELPQALIESESDHITDE